MMTPDMYTNVSRCAVRGIRTDSSLSVTVGLKPFVRITAKQAFVDADTPSVLPEKSPFTKKPDATANPMANAIEMKKKRLLLR